MAKGAPQGWFSLSVYFRLKRAFDVLATSFILFVLMPLTLITACLVLFDVGTPVLFWRQRIGRNGRKFLLYEFRTFQAPFDRTGARLAEDKRVSKLGRAIRAARLDKIPQLFNVLVGDMSLIGPRPLALRRDSGVAENDSGVAENHAGTVPEGENFCNKLLHVGKP
jgi:lipopolysaccharide/colanic/teichoic acid biosynthesis glycosyltransferase